MFPMRTGDLVERRINVYRYVVILSSTQKMYLSFSDCPLVAAPYESPGRGLRNERAHLTTKELDERIGQR